MMPDPRDEGSNPRRDPPSDAIASGVMLPVFPDAEGQLSIILTVRSDEIEQGGQICFPGGRTESVESPVEAAFRETEEEIGVPSKQIAFLGKLTPLYVNSSNSLIHPAVGFMDRRPAITRDPYEVREVFTTRLESLTGPDNLRCETWTLKGRSFYVPFWDIHEVPLWGATAMILAEFLDLYNEFKSKAQKK